jgi:hypothetical protein
VFTGVDERVGVPERDGSADWERWEIGFGGGGGALTEPGESGGGGGGGSGGWEVALAGGTEV